MSCMICCETYTKAVRKRVACAYCDTACCAPCFSQYVLGLSAEPFCMNNECKHAFDRDFLAMHMPKTWLLTKYKAHRERVLLEREMAMLPATQEALQNYKYAQGLHELLEQAVQRRRALQRELIDLNRDIGRTRHELDVLVDSMYTRRWGGPHADSDAAARERRQFIRACPADGCRGFLSSAWKCGTCDVWVCKDCGEPKLGGQHDERHVCNPDVAASFAMLQRDSRPCPQCAAMIFKLSGCDQASRGRKGGGPAWLAAGYVFLSPAADQARCSPRARRCFAPSATWPSAGARARSSPAASSTSESGRFWAVSRQVYARAFTKEPRVSAFSRGRRAARTTTRGCARREARCRATRATCPAAACRTSTSWSASCGRNRAPPRSTASCAPCTDRKSVV